MKRIKRISSLMLSIVLLTTSIAFADIEKTQINKASNLLKTKSGMQQVIDEYFQARENALNATAITEQKYVATLNKAVDINNTALMSLETKRLEARENMAKYHDVHIISAESHPYVQEVREINENGYNEAYEVAVKEWTWIYYNDGNGGEIDEMAYATEHQMTVATKNGSGYRIINNIYDEDQFIGKAEINRNTDSALMENNLQQNAVDIQTFDLSNFDINELIHYADLYVGVDCINSSGYNPKYANLNGSGGDCANYVSQCLLAGGLQRDDTWYAKRKTGSSIYTIFSNAWATAPSLKNYLESQGYSYVNATQSNVFPGNPVYCYVQANSGYTHVGICVGYNNSGVPIINAHNNDIYHMPYTYFTVNGNGPKTVRLFTCNKLGDKPDGSNAITFPSSGSKTKSLAVSARKSKYVKIIHPSGTNGHYTVRLSNALADSDVKGKVYLYQQKVGSNFMYERKFSESATNGATFSFSYSYNPSYTYFLRYYTDAVSGSKTINITATAS